jgi:hypothetical protein
MIMIARALFVTRLKKESVMPSTAGVIDSTPTRRLIHLSYIDVNEQVNTDSYEILASATDAQLNTFVAKMGAASNANLWRVAVTNEFAPTIGLKADAVDAVDDSVKDNIVILYKATTGSQAFDLYVPAPVEAMLVAGTLNPNPTATEFSELIAAADAVFSSYNRKSYRYSEHRKKNKVTRA